MQVVRQAHLPGNYELYNEESNVLGPVICKTCWEKNKRQNSNLLHTLWVSVEGWSMVWWLCPNHADKSSVESTGTTRFLRGNEGVVTAPKLNLAY